MNSEPTFWFFLTASAVIFIIYNFAHFYCILERRVLSVEYEQSRRSFEFLIKNPDRDAAKTFREGNSTMIATNLACAAIAFAGTIGAVTLLRNEEDKKELSIAMIITAMSACICFYLTTDFTNATTQLTVAPVCLNQPEIYMKDIFVKSFLYRKIGQRLLFFGVPLVVGWVPAFGGPLMLVAVVLLVLLLGISDTLSSAAISRQNQLGHHLPYRFLGA